MFNSNYGYHPSTTSPLPLSPNLIIDPQQFVVKFHQGLIVSLISLIIIFYVKTRHPHRLFSFTHRH